MKFKYTLVGMTILITFLQARGVECPAGKEEISRQTYHTTGVGDNNVLAQAWEEGRESAYLQYLLEVPAACGVGTIYTDYLPGYTPDEPIEGAMCVQQDPPLWPWHCDVMAEGDSICCR